MITLKLQEPITAQDLVYLLRAVRGKAEIAVEGYTHISSALDALTERFKEKPVVVQQLLPLDLEYLLEEVNVTQLELETDNLHLMLVRTGNDFLLAFRDKTEDQLYRCMGGEIARLLAAMNVEGVQRESSLWAYFNRELYLHELDVYTSLEAEMTLRWQKIPA